MDFESITSLIASRRREIGLTQSEVARRSGVSRRTIIAMENNDTEIGLARLIRILQALDLAITIAPGSGRPTESQLLDIFGDDDE